MLPITAPSVRKPMSFGFTPVESISDIVYLFIIIPRFRALFVLFFLTGKFFDLVKDYKARYMGIGQVDPNFKVFYEG